MGRSLSRSVFQRTYKKRAPMTYAQKKHKKAVKKRLVDAMEDLSKKHECDIQDFANVHGVRYEWARKKFNRVTLYRKGRNIVSNYNAFLHERAKTYTKATGRKKIPTMCSDPEIKAEFEALTDAEIQVYVERLVQHRKDKGNVMHHSAKAQATDLDRTIQDVGVELAAVANRCDVNYILLVANRNSSAFGGGKIYISEGVEGFTRQKLNCTPNELAVEFDGWSVGRSGAVVAGDIECSDPATLKKQARDLLNKMWRDAIGDSRPVYNEYNALHSHGAEFFGWSPVGPPNFQKLNTAPLLRQLVALIKAGKAGWRKVPATELQARIDDLDTRADSGENVVPKPRQKRKDAGTHRQPMGLNGATRADE